MDNICWQIKLYDEYEAILEDLQRELEDDKTPDIELNNELHKDDLN